MTIKTIRTNHLTILKDIIRCLKVLESGRTGRVVIDITSDNRGEPKQIVLSYVPLPVRRKVISP